MTEQMAPTSDPLLTTLLAELQQRFQPHTVILYGSRARGDYGPQSDLDLACFCEKPSRSKLTEQRDGLFLDIWLYANSEMDPHSAEFLKLVDGVCLLDQQGRGASFLAKLQAHYQQGPTALNPEDRELLLTWVAKTLVRIKTPDLEGHFRKLWLAVDLLEIYFQLRQCWYLGPKRSFQWLATHDPEAHRLFQQAYAQPELQSLQSLADYVLQLSDK